VSKAIDLSWEEERIAFYQRRLKKKRFSQNWQKVQAKIRKLHRRIANIRQDATHKATDNISKTHAVVVLGDLDAKTWRAQQREGRIIPARVCSRNQDGIAPSCDKVGQS
jgi:transposase